MRHVIALRKDGLLLFFLVSGFSGRGPSPPIFTFTLNLRLIKYISLQCPYILSSRYPYTVHVDTLSNYKKKGYRR